MREFNTSGPCDPAQHYDDVPIPFTVDDPDIAYLYAHGVIDNVNGFVDIPIPLYQKRLITALRPKLNGEVVFSRKHRDSDPLFFDEIIDGKRIYTYIIRTNFPQPSRRRPRKTSQGG